MDFEKLFQDAAAAFDAGDLGRAESLLKKLDNKVPNQHAVLHLRGLVALRAKKSKIAVKYLKQAVAINPKPDLLNALGSAYSQSEAFEDAIEVLGRAVKESPGDATAVFNLGNALKNKGRSSEALLHYQAALEIEPNFNDAHYNMGLVLAALRRFEDAVRAYDRCLDLNPDDAEAHRNLGLALKGLGKLDEAVASYHKALAIKPDYAEAHSNLGNALRNLGKLDEAVASYQKALAIKPDYAGAHINLGLALQDLGNLDDAVASYHEALAIDPDYAEAHNNLGNAFRNLEKLDEAVASYHKALTIKPDYAEAHSNLGLALKDLGKLDEAVASYHKALAIKPDYAQAHSNLGNALWELGRLDKAVAHYHKAIDIKPDYAGAHSNLGNVLCELGCFAEAKAAYDQGFHINHGGSWWNAATFADGDSVGTTQAAGAMFTSTFKLQDTIDRLEYLIAKGRIDPSFQRMADGYRAVLAEIQLMEEPEAVTKLTPSQFERIGSYYNRVIHYAEAPRIGTGVINESLDFKQIEDHYFSSPVSVTTLDDFLTPEALRGLRDFCLESTIYFANTGNYFLQSRLADGFNCELLYQLAEEVKERFPRILGGHHLANIWTYRYNNQSGGVAAHTDMGAVTFNLWITPDDANRVPDRGGLVIYTKEQPYDWDWRYYNIKKYTPTVSREIADFLADADTLTIPHRENRALLFHSNLFHKSDHIHFRDGFENRRMNVTLLFGKREG